MRIIHGSVRRLFFGILKENGKILIGDAAFAGRDELEPAFYAAFDEE